MKDVQALDEADPLARFRDQFELPHGMVYLAGHSLGPLPRQAVARLAETVQNEWGRALVSGWDACGWIGAPQRIGARIAPLIGAAPDEVIVGESTSVTLFKLIAALLLHRPERRTLLIESREFPTDMQVAAGAVAALGRGRKLKFAKPGKLAEKIDEKTALVIASLVHFRDGRVRDIDALQRKAQEAGAYLIWDLSHAIGAIPVDLNASYADFAVGCGYKYLNGGPGAPAFLYVSKRWQDKLDNPISGWLGHADPFSFADHYTPAPGLARFISGTPMILSLAGLEAGVALMNEADAHLRLAKTRALQALFLERVFARRRPGLALLSPEDPAARGAHLSLMHKNAQALIADLAAKGVMGDFRPPNIVRFAFAPLFTRYEDAARAADALVDALK